MSSFINRNASTRSAIRLFPEYYSQVDAQVDAEHCFTVKDNFMVKGFPTSAGFAPPLIPVAKQTAPLIDLLREKGHTLIAACNLDPGAIGAKGENPFWGNMTSDAASHVSGSSGGSAASVADGWAAFSLVTDIAGSARLPAISTGTIGFKFRSSALPREGVLLYHPTIDTIGIIAKNLDVLQSVFKDLPLSRETQKEEETIPEILNLEQHLHDLLPKIAACHKRAVGFSITKADWLKKAVLTEELQALRLLGDSVSELQIKEELSELESEFQKRFTPPTLFETEIATQDKLQTLFVLSNLFDWPAVVTPTEHGRTIHLTGPVTEHELLSALIRRIK